MHDRQYLSSLVLFVVALAAVLGGLAAVPLWFGWPGAAGLAATAGGFLVWFYWGPRSDLRPAARRAPGGRPDHE